MARLLDAQAIFGVLQTLRVSTVRTIADIFVHKFKDIHSAQVQVQKHLNYLVATHTLVRGRGWYAVPEYRGEFKEHDRLITEVVARLILLKLPISVYREVSFPVGLRSDIVALIGRNGKGLCVIVEVANNKTPAYFNQKITAWKNWQGAPQALSNLFGTPIPHFSLVAHGISHPDAIDLETFIEEAK